MMNQSVALIRSLLAVSLSLYLWVSAALSLSGSAVVAQVSKPDASPVSKQAQSEAQQAMLERQATIQRLLPDLEATTVCLQAGGGSGSGVIVSKDGLILTAAHVVENAKEVKVLFIDGRKLTAKVLGIYKPTDVAMAQLVDAGPHKFADIASKGTLSVGQTILATGHPSGFDEQRGIPLRIGHIVSLNGGFFSSDAPLIGGDSGGPSFNLQGQVVGIHSNITGDMSVNNDAGIDTFIENWDSLKRGEVRGQKLFETENAQGKLVLGLKLFSSAEGEPIRIKSVVAETPASWAGLKPEDQIFEVNGGKVGDPKSFMSSLQEDELGRALKLRVRREGEWLTLDVKLLTRKELKAERARKADDPGTSEKSSDQGAGEDQVGGGRFGEAHLINCGVESGIKQEEPQTKAASKSKTELQRLLEQSRENGGRLKIDRERLRVLRDKLNRRLDTLAPIGGRRRDEWGAEFRDAFGAHTAKFSASTFRVFVSGRSVAKAVLVDGRGYLVSKASELEGRKVTIALSSDVRLVAKLIEIHRDLDLALLKVNPTLIPDDAVPLDLEDHAKRLGTGPVKGTVCGAIGVSRTHPAGFGVVSVAARALDGNTSAYLGVEPKTTANESGAELGGISPRGPADRSGLKVGDVVEAIGGQVIKTADDLNQAIRSKLPNEEVKLNIRRGDHWLTLPVQLGDKSKIAPMPGAKEQGTDGISTAMSRRRWNFSRGIQHDCGIQPKDCGGVLIDLHGNVIGLNIARAGRIKSYAIPVKLVSEFVARVLAGRVSEGGK